MGYLVRLVNQNFDCNLFKFFAWPILNMWHVWMSLVFLSVISPGSANQIVAKSVFPSVIAAIVQPSPLPAAETKHSYTSYVPSGYDSKLFMIHRLFDGAHVFNCEGDKVLEEKCQKVIADSAVLDVFNAYFLWDFAESRQRLKDTLPEIKRIFECIKIGCDQYSDTNFSLRRKVTLGSDEAMDYLSCVLNIDTISFNKQKKEALHYFKSNLPSINKSFYKENQSKYSVKMTMPTNIGFRFLYIKNDHFKECKHLSIEGSALKLLYRMGPIYSPNQF